ncbi:MAG: UbiA family prenyltransferase, partial [Fibrobacterota bacterium]
MMKRILDLLFLTRPVVLVPVWGFALFGYRAARGAVSFWSMPDASAVLRILLFSLSVAAVYVVNQIADYDVDCDNGGAPLMVRSGISPKTAWIWAAFLSGLSLVIPLILSFPLTALLSLFSLIIG